MRIRPILLLLVLFVFVALPDATDSRELADLPKYLQPFLKEPTADLKEIRSLVLDKHEVPEGSSSTLLCNGFTYYTDWSTRVVRVEGTFASNVQMQQTTFDSILNSIMGWKQQTSPQPPQSTEKSTADVAKPPRLRANRRAYTKLLAMIGIDKPTGEYHAGHLIMHSYCPCDHPLNLLPQNQLTNQGSQAKIERYIRSLQNMGDVHLVIDVLYPSWLGNLFKRRLFKNLDQRPIYMPVRYNFHIRCPSKGFGWSFLPWKAEHYSIANPTDREVYDKSMDILPPSSKRSLGKTNGTGPIWRRTAKTLAPLSSPLRARLSSRVTTDTSVPAKKGRKVDHNYIPESSESTSDD